VTGKARRLASKIFGLPVSRGNEVCVDPWVKSDADGELLARLRRGDERAFDAAYARHAPRLFRFLLRMCSRAAAEDVLQEVWLKLATRAAELAPDTDLGAWLFTVARNGWLGRARSEGRMPLMDAARAEEVARLERALARLSAADREALLLVGVEGMAPAVAAKVVGISDLAFRQRLHRARARLGAEMERPRRASGDGIHE
jgi:RNA polymerase sigma-70 factor (ECF subfamily)